MAYKTRPGVVLVKICGTDLLVATRPIWDECARVRPIPMLWAGCWRMLENGKTEQDVVRLFSKFLRKPEKSLVEKFEIIFLSLYKEGFLIKTEDDV